MSWLRRPSRYAQVGLACALMNNFIVMGLDRVGGHYLVGVIAATLLVTPFGFVMHCGYTYRVPPSLNGLLRFSGGIALGAVITILAMVALCDGFGMSATAAIPLVTVFVFGCNYLLATWALVREAVTPPGF